MTSSKEVSLNDKADTASGSTVAAMDEPT